MKNKVLFATEVILGIILIALAIFYWITPSGSLPSFFPGFAADGTTIHIKHGIAAFILGILAFAFAWFQSKSV